MGLATILNASGGNDSAPMISDVIGLEDRLKSLDDRILEYRNIRLFPEVGRPQTIYIDTTNDIHYRWDTRTKTYKKIGFEPKDIKVINCNFT